MSKTSRRASRPAGAASNPNPGPVATSTAAGGRRDARTRAGRRERARVGYARKSLLERYRAPIIGVAIVAGIAVLVGVLVMGATAKTYTCTRIWEPTPTASPSPGHSPRLGYVQQDMGNQHDPPVPTRYTLCPPASGPHFNVSGQGPIRPQLYGPEDYAPPQGWIHNLEHGGLVVLYRGGEGIEAVTDEFQATLREFYRTLPASPICGAAPGQPGAGLVIARFDDMAWPYAALVWDRVLPLETWDSDLVRRFWQTEGERTNPEPFVCPRPTPTPAPSESPAPSGSPAPSPSAS